MSLIEIRRLELSCLFLCGARALGLRFDRRSGFDGGTTSLRAHSSEPFAHGFRQADAEHRHVVGNFFAQAFLSALGEDRLAFDAKFLGELIDSNTFSQIDLLN